MSIFFVLLATQGATLGDAFVTEAPAAWKEYSEQARLLQGTQKVKMRLLNTETGAEIGGWNLQADWRTNGRDMSYALAQEKIEKGKIVQQEKECFALNEKYGFILRRHKGVWSASSLSRGVELAEFRTKFFPYAGASIPQLLVKVDEVSLGELVRLPGFRIKECSASSEFVTVVFDVRDGEQVLYGKLVMDPKNFWCLREYEAKVRFSDGVCGVSRMKVLETRAAGKLSWPARMTTELEYENRCKKIEYEADFQIPNWLPDAEEFRLTHYSLAEPSGVTWPARPPWRTYLGLGTVFLLMAVLAWRCRK